MLRNGRYSPSGASEEERERLEGPRALDARELERAGRCRFIFEHPCCHSGTGLHRLMSFELLYNEQERKIPFLRKRERRSLFASLPPWQTCPQRRFLPASCFPFLGLRSSLPTPSFVSGIEADHLHVYPFGRKRFRSGIAACARLRAAQAGDGFRIYGLGEIAGAGQGTKAGAGL